MAPPMPPEENAADDRDEDVDEHVHIPQVEPPDPEEAERIARDAPRSAKAERLFRRGRELAREPSKVRMLVEDAVRKAARNEGALRRFWDELQLMIAFVRDSVVGRYHPDMANLGLAIGALLYFLSPFDLIPDFIVGMGYLDDATVLAFATHKLSDELHAYRVWRDTIEIEASAPATTVRPGTDDA